MSDEFDNEIAKALENADTPAQDSIVPESTDAVPDVVHDSIDDSNNITDVHNDDINRESPEPMMYNDDNKDNDELRPVDLDENNYNDNISYRNNMVNNEESKKYYNQLIKTKEHCDKLYRLQHVKSFTKTKKIKKEYILTAKKIGIKTTQSCLVKSKKPTIWYINTIVPGNFENVYHCFYDFNNHRKIWDVKNAFNYERNIFYKDNNDESNTLYITKESTLEKYKLFNRREYINIGKLYKYNSISNDKWGVNTLNSNDNNNSNNNDINVFEFVSFCIDLVDPNKFPLMNKFKDKDDKTKKIERGQIIKNSMRFYHMNKDEINKNYLPDYMPWTNIENIIQIDDNLVNGWTPKYVIDKLISTQLIERYDAFREYLFEHFNLIQKPVIQSNDDDINESKE